MVSGQEVGEAVCITKKGMGVYSGAVPSNVNLSGSSDIYQAAIQEVLIALPPIGLL